MRLHLTRIAADRIRTLLHIRKPRASPPPGPRPSPGARISFGDVRMTVQAGMARDLWIWLQREGWREIRYRPDRRRYFDVPPVCVSELFECAAEHRRDYLDKCIAHSRAN